MDPESSFDLVQRAQGGDAAALERLLARYRPRLRRWAAGRLPRYARGFTDTDDLVQDALIKTVRNLPSFDAREEWALQAYLRRAVTNRIRDELQRHKARPAAQGLPDSIAAVERSPLETAIGAEVFARYNAALDTLDDREREAVIARVELGCSFEEIAALVGKPGADAARMAVSRALRKLAGAMKDLR